MNLHSKRIFYFNFFKKADDFIKNPIQKRKDSSRAVLKTGESQRKNGTYSFRWTDEFGIRRDVYAQTLKELRQKEDAITKDRLDGIFFSPESLTLEDYFKKWFAVKRGIRPSTANLYLNSFKNHINPKIGNNPLSRLGLTDLKRFYIYLNEEKFLGIKTIQLIHVLINQVLDSAVAEHIIRDNPAKRAFKEFKSVTDKNCSSKKALTAEEQQALIEFVSKSNRYKRWRNIIIIFLGTGLRVGELTALLWSDIDFDNSTINVSKTLTYYKAPKEKNYNFHFHNTKTSSGNRIIPMSKIVRDAFISEKEKQKEKNISGTLSVDGKSDFCFLSCHGKPFFTTGINDPLENIVNSYNRTSSPESLKLPPISCHTFRHSFATRMFESGVDPKIIQEIMGHSSLSITMDIYTDVSISIKKRDVEAIDCFLSA